MKIVNVTGQQEFAEKLAAAFQYEDAGRETQNESVTSETVIIADLKETLTDEQKQIVRDGLENESTIVFNNTTNERLSEFALFGVAAENVILKSKQKGRQQDIVVVNAAVDGPVPMEDQALDTTAESASIAEEFAKSLAKGEPLPELTPEEGDGEGDEDVSSGNETTEIEEIPPPTSNADSIARMIEVLNFSEAQSGEESNALEPINRSQASGRVIFTQVSWNPKGWGKTCTIFGSFTIELAAVLTPVRSKYVKITSVGTAVGATTNPDSDYNKSWFTRRARVIAYPGYHYTFDTNSVRLPSGWRRIAIAPETPNSVTTYTKTTGWSIGASAGATVSTDPNVTVGLEASYSESERTTENIMDFRVKNYSSAAACNWVYEYSKVVDGWTSMFYQPFFKKARIHGLAALAKSTMFLKNEAIYEAPANAGGHQRFIFYIGQHVARLWETGDWARYHHHIDYAAKGNWQYLDVNMSMVQHP